MRKNFKLLTALAVAVAATGCSNDDLMTGLESRSDGAVGVNAYVPTITRGTALNNSTEFEAEGNGFDLFAYKKADNSNFMGTSTDGIAFTYQTSKWDYETATEKVFWEEAGGSDVTFYAVSPKFDKIPANTATLNIAANEQIINYTVPTTSAEQVDLMYAKTDVLSSSSGDHLTNGITLDFQHALSQIVFSGKIADDDGYISSVKVNAVSLTSVQKSGIYTFPVGKTDVTNKINKGIWNTSGSTTEKYSAAFVNGATDMTINATTATELSSSNDALLLIPQSVKDVISVKVSAEITLKSGSPITIDTEVALQTEKWDEGCKYIYTLVFSAESLNPVTVWETKVASWDDVLEDVEIKGESVSLKTIEADETEYGDVLLSNGKFAKHNAYVEYLAANSDTPSTADETSSSSSETLKAVGMVFHKFVGGSTTTKAETISDGNTNNFTKGLIVALDDLTYNGNPGMYWQTTAATVTGAIANHNDLTSSADNSLNNILGQQHTAALFEFNRTQTSDDKKVIPVLALDEWTKTNPNPEGTSGWYIPSAKELDILANGADENIKWQNSSDGSKISTLNEKLKSLGGEEFDTEHPTTASASDPYAAYWSCSEYSDFSDSASYVAFADGSVSLYSKATGYLRVRAVCAF